MNLYQTSTLAALYLCFLSIGCTPRASLETSASQISAHLAVNTPVDPGPIYREGAELPSLSWAASGEQILVGSQWLFTPKQNEWISLDHAASFAKISPDGERILLFGAEGSRFQQGPVQGPWSELLSPPSTTQQAIPPAYSAMGWRTNSEVLILRQWYNEDHSDLTTTCHTYHVTTKQWAVPKAGCPKAAMLAIYNLDGNASEWLVLESSGEGHPAVTLLRYRPNTGQLTGALPDWDLYPFGPLQVRFSSTGLILETPCHLESPERPCQDPFSGDGREDALWRLYHWSFDDSKLDLLHRGLPQNSTLSPQKDQVAWPRPGGLCVEASQGAKERICSALPQK